MFFLRLKHQQGAALGPNGAKIRSKLDRKEWISCGGLVRQVKAEPDPVFQSVWTSAFWSTGAPRDRKTAALRFPSGALRTFRASLSRATPGAQCARSKQPGTNFYGPSNFLGVCGSDLKSREFLPRDGPASGCLVAAGGPRGSQTELFHERLLPSTRTTRSCGAGAGLRAPVLEFGKECLERGAMAWGTSGEDHRWYLFEYA